MSDPIPNGDCRMRCSHCDEEIRDGEASSHLAGLNQIHRECLTRMLAGSLGHQLKMCRCYGGTIEDPSGLTRRQAARLADRFCLIAQDNPPSSRVALWLVDLLYPGQLRDMPDWPVAALALDWPLMIEVVESNGTDTE